MRREIITPEDQLNLRLRHSNYEKFLDFNEKESERIKKQYNCFLNVKYGKHPLQDLDIFPSKVSNSPILIFIHGGYWRALDKKSYGFVAEPFIKNDITVCVINYRLIPMVNMEMVLTDVNDAILWIQKEAIKYNGDPDSLIVSGHSAGGHLALMAYLLNESIRPSIQGICSLSGLFDLAPIRSSYLNEVLQLDEEDVRTYSISNGDLSLIECPLFLAVGGDETDLFIQQSRNLYDRNKRLASIKYYKYESLNHYQIVHKLGQENNSLTEFLIENARISGSNKK